MAEQKETLKSMLDAGKVTPEQYQEMYEKEFASTLGKTTPIKRPWQVWVCAILLFISAIVGVLSINKEHLALGVSSFLNTILGIGLLFQKRWAFIATFIFGIIAVVGCIIEGWIIDSIINLAIVIILATAWKYYSELT